MKQLHSGQKILENKSPFIDALVEDYGYSTVFSNGFVTLNVDLVKNLHKIINKIVFHNALTEYAIKHDVHNEHCGEHENTVMCYFAEYYEDTFENPTKYILLTTEGIDHTGVLHYKPVIYISPDVYGKSKPFMSIVNIVAHEMIHQQLAENGVDEQKLYDSKTHHTEYEQHYAEFLAIADDINTRHGLHIVAHGLSTYDLDVHNSLKSFAGNDYDDLAEDEHHDYHDSILDKIVSDKNGFITTSTV